MKDILSLLIAIPILLLVFIYKIIQLMLVVILLTSPFWILGVIIWLIAR